MFEYIFLTVIILSFFVGIIQGLESLGELELSLEDVTNQYEVENDIIVVKYILRNTFSTSTVCIKDFNIYIKCVDKIFSISQVNISSIPPNSKIVNIVELKVRKELITRIENCHISSNIQYSDPNKRKKIIVMEKRNKIKRG